LKETKEILDTLVTIQPRASGGVAGKSPEDLAIELAKEFESKLPDVLDRSLAHESTFKDIESTNTLGVFLGQELDRFNKLLKVMKSSLAELQQAIQGLVVMSSDLEEMFNSFLFNIVPKSWENAAYPSLKPLASWFEDFQKRMQCMRDWIVNGPPKCFWLPGFFFPQGFMTGVLQKYARRTKIPIDTLKIQCHPTTFAVDEPECKAPEKGVLINGLHLQGAGWDRENKLLVESDPGVLFVEMPCIWLQPVSMDDPPLENVYSCPLYKTSTRAGTLSTTGHSTNFVLFLELPSEKDSDHWIRRGTALLTMLDT
jgi:dynein heavy chain